MSAERSGEFVDAMRRLGAGSEPLAIDIDLISQVSSVMGRAEAPLGPPETQRIGELAMQLPPMVVRFYAKYLPGTEWPGRFHAMVVKVQTGQLRVLGRATKYPLKLASPHLVPLPVSLPQLPFLTASIWTAALDRQPTPMF